MNITALPDHERPRERLLALGASRLSDAELLSIFLRTGTKGMSAIELAQQLITEFGGLSQLFKAPEQRVCQQKGLGKAKFAQLQACLELTKRIYHDEWLASKPYNLHNIREYLKYFLQEETKEKFVVIYFDHGNSLIATEVLFEGTINRLTIHKREFIHKILDYHATKVLVAHNHPSGFARASYEDIVVTQDLKRALSAIDVELVDHLVVGHRKITSVFDQVMS